jgi:Protein of unknown function (DUF4232)
MTISASGPRRLLLVATLGPVAVAAAACSGPASSSSLPAPRTTYATPAHMAKCATSALRIKVGARTAVAGLTSRNIDFTNVGSAECFLQGYPAAAMVSAGSGSGNLIGSYARPDPVTPAKPIVLASGQTAHAVVGAYKLGSHLATNCDPVTPHWLKVFPPGQTMPAYVPFTVRICAASAARTLQITPIIAGA